MKKTYIEKLRDPRWQKKRLKVLERDEWACQLCFDSESTLNVHHKYYLKGYNPWDYPMEALVSLCETCHISEKENRYEQEKRLIKALKKHFFTEDIEHLATYINEGKLFHIPGLIIDVLGWFFCDENIQKKIISQYLEYLKRGVKTDAQK